MVLGKPCPCGGTSLTRVRSHIVRCNSCGASLFADPPPPPPSAEPKPKGKKGRPPALVPLDPGRTLAAYRDGRLRLVESTLKARRYEGFAVAPSGERVFVAIRVPIVDGSPLPHMGTALGWAHEITEERAAEPHEEDTGPWDLSL